jgi:hybrid cluster-associated redox disulfide protein
MIFRILLKIVQQERKMMDARIQKDMIIADLLQVDPGIGPILMASGMHCLGCPASQGESLEEAAAVHGLEADHLVEIVNEYLAKK